ncbi:MAG: hypothetical protein C0514_02125 [Candidatus Puniceispirillum sp.]|nr:hypothetical protein [Candidatus Puniceispirillum sp.]
MRHQGFHKVLQINQRARMLHFIREHFLLPPRAIKEENDHYLLERGARICAWLPTIEHRTCIRGAREIGQRAAVLYGLFQIYLRAPTQVIRTWFEKNRLMGYLSPNELELIEKHEDELCDQERCDLSWNVEAIYALLWAGSVFDTLDVQKYVPDTLVNVTPDIQENESADKLRRSIKTRPYAQIYKMLDLYYRASWYVVDANLVNEDTKDFNYSVIMTRRQALEWVYDPTSSWDHIDLST